ncbi:GTP-binding protein-like protein Obg [Lophiotrema nucula]|uniref:GTP-binding protein-like protein Obg n=1 Tax=Lophiotrema nucula TaxID=690887 RepID=A0A6A5ZA63_9PLEO|nr:GTP-binding protein-like protein Obg [Lophiotrema nucula]
MPPIRLGSFGTLTPFLYPAFSSCRSSTLRKLPLPAYSKRLPSSSIHTGTQDVSSDISSSRLNPAPDNYSVTPFADRCILTVEAGSGGHGCVSFVREKYIEEGPPNGGDGGSGGNVYIQAVRGETSLHKLARRRLIKAGRGRNGQGKMRGGERGEDVLITVPIGTIVREIERKDPVAVAMQEEWEAEHYRKKPETEEEEEKGNYGRDKWLVFPGLVPAELNRMVFPTLPKSRKSHLAALQPEAPVYLDLDKHMETPMLLAAGAMGGVGNPHFATTNNPRPKMATRGDEGMKLNMQLELKLLADLGLVGLPNAGKSTLTRALTNSKARIGNWAFTTLQPNVGTVVLDNHQGRAAVTKRGRDGMLRENFLIADVPGLIEDAHLDKGLGLGFLRHVERAAVLAFIVDLSAGDAVEALKLLWREVSEYEALRGRELNAETERRMVNYSPTSRRAQQDSGMELDSPEFGSSQALPPISSTPISSKPWFVVATKADLPNTQDNYKALRSYLDAVNNGAQPHPSGRKHAWKRNLQSVPVSAINAQGVDVIPQLVMDLLEE